MKTEVMVTVKNVFDQSVADLVLIIGQLSAPTMLSNGIKRNEYFDFFPLPFSLMRGY